MINVLLSYAVEIFEKLTIHVLYIVMFLLRVFVAFLLHPGHGNPHISYLFHFEILTLSHFLSNQPCSNK